VRLSSKEVDAIVVGVNKIFGDAAQVWLFGSRVDDNKRGGDIDLYVECNLQQGLALAKIKLLSHLAETFDEQKIDILVQSTQRPQHPLGTIAKAQGLRLG
jgi:predicted nucleotidyltransferase